MNNIINLKKELIDYEKESFAIVVTCCGECPYVETFQAGKEFACKHPSTLVKFPYASKRMVSPHSIDVFVCPFKNGEA